MSFVEDGELSGATATATPESEAQVDSGEGSGETPAAGDAESVTKETTAEGAETEETATAEEGQPPAPLPEGWQDHPDTKAHVDTQFEERYNEKFNTERSERDKQHRQELGRREERYGVEVKDAFQQGQAIGVITELKEIAEEGGLDTSTQEGARNFYKLLNKHAAWGPVVARIMDEGQDVSFVKHISGTYREAGLSEEVVAELDDFQGEIGWKVRHKEIRLIDAAREVQVESLKRARADGVKAGEQNEKDRRDKLEREMKGPTDRAGKRKVTSPPAAPSGAGAGSDGRSDRERQLDPTTPVATLREIKARREAGR